MDFINGWAKREGQIGYVRGGQAVDDDGPIQMGDSFVVRHIGGALVFAKYERQVDGYMVGPVTALHPWPIIPGSQLEPGNQVGAKMDEIVTILRRRE